MISDIDGSIYWGALQVGLISLLGILGSLMFSGRHPNAARRIACVTIAVAGLLTLLAPSQVHHWLAPSWNSSTEANATTSESPEATEKIRTESTRSPTGFAVDGRTLAAALRQLAETLDVTGTTQRRSLHPLTWCWLCIAGVGMIQLASGIASVLRTQRTGTPVDNADLQRFVEEVAGQIGLRTIPTLRVSSSVASAAIAGWFKPVLILPAYWTKWGEQERRAVLAHEMSHLARYDSLWRLAAAVVTALNFGNPFVHWLMRRVVLYQELCADELAASVVGHRSYLRSLSNLVMQYDDYRQGRMRLDVFPVFSGQLSRRIQMLRSMDGTRSESCRAGTTSATMIVVITIFMTAVGVVAVRGFAQPPQVPPSKTAVAPRVASLEKPAADMALDPTARMFGLPGLDPSIIPENKDGMFAVRISEILKRDELRPHADVLNAFAADGLKSLLNSESVPPIDLRAIEWVAGQCVMTLGKIPDATGPEKNRVSFGTGPSGVVLKLTHNADLPNWISKYAPNANRHVIEDRDVFNLGTIPALGPVPCWIALRDESTIVISAVDLKPTPETKLEEIFGKRVQQTSRTASEPTNSPSPPTPTDSSRWVSSWKRLGGGMVNVVFTGQHIGELEDLAETASAKEREVAALCRPMLDRDTTYAFGFDLATDPSVVGIRIRLSIPSHERATQSADAIRKLLTLLDEQSKENVEDAEDETDAKMVQLALRFAKSVAVKIDDKGDGTSEISISGTLPLNDLIALILQSSLNE